MIRGPIDGKYVELWGIPAWRRKLGIGDESLTLTQRIELIVAAGAGSVDNANARLAAFSTLEEAGYIVQTSTFPPAFAGRQIVGVPNRINVTNGTGINGNTILQTPQDIHTGAIPEFQTIKPTLLTPEFVTYVNAVGELDSTGVTAAAINTISLGTPGYFPFWLGGAGGLSSTSAIYTDGTLVGIGTITPSVTLHATTEDFTTTSVTDVLKLEHKGTAFLGVNSGTGILFSASSLTVHDRDMARVQARWAVATDATRTAVIDWQTVNAGGALTSRMTLSGPGLSFVTVLPPVAAVATAGAAGALTGAYTYKVEYVTANGHTELGTVSNTVNPAGQQVDLTSIPVSTDPKVTGRRIFRTAAGNIYYFLLTTLNDNTTTTYTDNTADGALEPLLGEGRNFEDNTTGGTLRYNDFRSLFTGYENTFVGINAGRVNDAGYHNTFIGGDAGYSNVDGYWLTAVGHKALYSNVGTAATANTAIGGLSFYSNVSGNTNTGIGYRTGYSCVSGNSNFFGGYRASHELTTGSFNVVIGYVAGYNNNGSSMTIVGALAGNDCLTASNGVAIGTEALRYNTASLECVAVGASAARGSGVYVAERIVCLGYDAGRNISTGAHGNILIGYKAGDVITTGAFNIVIGRECDPPAATSNNTLCIGNLIYGTGLNDINTNISTGSISIGTKTPNLGSVTRALTVTSLTTGNSIVSLELQGSRLVNNAAFGLVDFYHQATNVASVGGMRGTADDAGLIGFWTRASGGALINHWRIMEDGDLQAEGAGRIETTSSANLTAAAVGGNVILESNHVGIGTTTVNLGAVTKAVTLSAGVAGTAIADLEIQGSRTANNAAFGLVYFFHQTNAVAAFEAVRGTADNEGYIRIYARASGSALLEQISIRAGREIRFNGDGSIQTTSGILTLVGTSYVKVTSILSADTGFRVANAAASGAMLRGDGTNFIPSVSLWPNGATQGDIIFASAANTYSNLAKDANATRYLSNTGASNNPAWAQINLANGVTGTLPVTGGGTGTATASYTAGSVIFAGAGGTSLASDPANLFWDDSTNRLGIGNNAPGALLDLGLAGTTLGVMRLAGSTSGNVTIRPKAIAGTWTLTLPDSDGNNLDVLTTDGNGITSWSAPTSATHDMLSATHTDTTASAVSRGSLIVGIGASPAWAELNIGAAARLLRSDGTDATWAQAVLTTDVTGVLPTANGGTNHGNYTAGSVIFAGAGGTSLTEDNAQFFWDTSLSRLYIGDTTPAYGAKLAITNSADSAELTLTSTGIANSPTLEFNVAVAGADYIHIISSRLAGTPLPVWFYVGTTYGLRLTNDTYTSVVVGRGMANATTDTSGFLYLPTVNGVPTGVPITHADSLACVFDPNTDTLYIYNGGWKGVVVL